MKADPGGIVFRFGILLFLLIASAAGVNAQQEPPRLSILQVYLPQQDGDDSLERVLNAAMALSMEQAAPVRTLPVHKADTVVDLQQAMEAAGERDADLLLLGRYTIAGELLQIEFQLIDITDGSVLGATGAEREIDLLVDRLADAAVSDLVAQAGARIAAIIEARRPPKDTAQPVESPRRAESLSPETPEPPESTAGPTGGWEATVTVGAAVPLGSFATYFRPGATGEISIHYRTARFKAGITAGLTRFTPAEPDTGDYIRTFVPILADVQVPLGSVGGFTWVAGASAGVALRLPGDSPASGLLASVLPAWRISGTIRIPVSQRLTLSPGAALSGLLQFYSGPADDPGGIDHVLFLSPVLAIAWTL